MKKILYLFLIVSVLYGCTKQPTVSNFEECVEATGIVMESYPRKCRAPDGTVYTEEVEPIEEQPTGQEVEEALSEEVAREWILNFSPTYIFDGSDLKLIMSRALDCEICFEYEFSFTSSQAGFGDRTGKILAQVITPHTIVVQLQAGKIVSAITDTVFDEMAQEIISE